MGSNALKTSREYWENRLAKNWGLQGVGYIGYGLAYNKWMYKLRERVFRRHISALPIKLETASVLDIGSGTGFWLDAWKSLGVRSVIASDLTNVAVARLRHAYRGIQIIQLDITDSARTNTLPDQFDLISAFDVLFHITDDVAYRDAFLNISHLLTPGGYFFFSENFLHGKTKCGPRQTSRSIGEIEAELKACSMEIVRRAPMFVLMNSPVDSQSAWPSWAWQHFMYPVELIPALGSLYGAVMFPVELALTRVLHESPTTEIMICQKRSKLH